jgi:arylsulfatase A-like enzyme
MAAKACGPGAADAAGSGAASAPRAASRVLVVGMDGLEWSVLRPLLAAGKCPNMAALMRRGSFGRLSTLSLTLSPVVWTTIATGRMPKEHGILNFLDAQKRVFTSSQRRVRALWNIADQHGLSTNMFGWFITWPAEPIKGLVVSGSSSSALNDANWKPALVPSVEGQVWPAERTEEVMALAAQAGSQPHIAAIAREKVYGALPEGLLDAEQQTVQQQTLWSIAADETYFELARQYIKQSPADLNLVYFGGTDVVSHRYWRQFRPEGYQWSNGAEADAALAHVIPNYYEWVDSMLGELVAAAGPDATVFVLSDHGFHAVAQDKPDPLHMTGHHMDAPPGVLIAAGPGIVVQGEYDRFVQSGSLASLGSVLDVTPTVLALLGIPGSREMEGRAYRPMLTEGPAREAAKLPLVESHDGGFRPAAAVPVPTEMDESFRKKFGELGYTQIEVDPSVDIQVVPPSTAPVEGAPGPGAAPR